MSENNKNIIRRSFEARFNTGNLDIMDELYAHDFVYHDGDCEIHGLEAFKQGAAKFHDAFPDAQVTIENQIAEGDRVVTQWKAQGTHKGEYMGIAPTGKMIKGTGITIHRISEGKIVEGWSESDKSSLYKQLGVTPQFEKV